ncbi:hypothetical protein ALC60_08726 [Trachymyrmex zeteki]|uniref:Uncharacterized protein n=1 Tax=Mycetomoellerius zeteki TaxID=64791 RepID=A0A151WW31_9HYME|nr:hypothetical protein ALC60_08726 [Trachymyrmex zeteki]
MHHGGVIPCRWPWELLGSSSLGGPEKVATVKRPIREEYSPRAIAEKVDLALLLHDSLRLMKRADAGFAGGRRRAGTGAGRQGAGPTAARLDHLRLAGAAAVRGDDVIAVIRRAGRHGQARPGVLTVASLLLLRLVFVGAVARHVAETGRHPVEVLLKVAATAAAAARLEREIVALLRPEILMTLTLGPAASAAAAFQIREYRLLPDVEALTVHELTDRTIVVIAGDLDRVVQGVEADEGVAAQTLAGRRAAARRLARAQQIIHGIVSANANAPVLQEATAATSVAAVGVTPRCHIRCDPPHTCKDTKSTDLAGDRFARLGDIQGVASPKNQGHSRVTTGPPAPVARSAHREGGILHGTRRDVPRCLYRRAGASESRSGSVNRSAITAVIKELSNIVRKRSKSKNYNDLQRVMDKTRYDPEEKGEEEGHRMLPSKTDDSDLSEGSRLRFETLAMGRWLRASFMVFAECQISALKE